MGRARIPPEGVVDAAIGLIDRHGFEALNLSTVAVALGVRPSALYGHVGGLDELRDRIAVTATHHLTDAVSAAAIGVAGARALDAVGHAYRGFAFDHPGQYAAILRPATPSNSELVSAGRVLHDVFARIYLGAGFSRDEADLVAGSTRSAIHGFVTLEHATGGGSGGGGNDVVDDRYRHLLRTLHRQLDGQPLQRRTPAS